MQLLWRGPPEACNTPNPDVLSDRNLPSLLEPKLLGEFQH